MKKIIIFVSILIAGFCISVFFYNAADFPNDIDHNAAQDTFNNVKTQEKQQTHSEISDPFVAVDDDLQPELLDKRPPLPLSGQHREAYDKAVATIETHMADIGYFYQDELDVYSAYTSDTLFSLVKAGDLLAIQVLAERTLAAGDYENARFLYIDAAMRGSVDALNRLAGMTIVRGEELSKSGDREVALRYGVESDAWLTLVQKRGFYDLAIHPDPINLISLDSQARLDMNAINAQADEYYNLMTVTRHKLGLGDFDNQSVTEYVNSMNKIYELGAMYTLPFDEYDVEE